MEVKPGYSEETVLRFAKKGHQAFGAHPSDLVVRFRQVHEDCYSRRGDDIIYHHECDLVDSFDPKPFSIKLFDSKTIFVTPTQAVTPQSEHVVAGAGMPRCTTGDITFDTYN